MLHVFDNALVQGLQMAGGVWWQKNYLYVLEPADVNRVYGTVVDKQKNVSVLGTHLGVENSEKLGKESAGRLCLLICRVGDRKELVTRETLRLPELPNYSSFKFFCFRRHCNRRGLSLFPCFFFLLGMSHPSY